ncbi:hypothetical protein HY572_03275 [Candidatus Micrarchaeota archaeon]|nr:hypothetical protein [Candidatus Micrarchaeota archaeon]
MGKFSFPIAGALLLLSIVGVQGFSMDVSYDAVHTQGTVAQVYAYSSENAAFSVESEYTNAQVTQYGDHALIKLLAPDCLVGTETIRIKASNGTNTQTKTLQLTHEPRKNCEKYIHVQPLDAALERPQSLYFSHEFDATHYAMQVDAGESCTPVTVGQTFAKRIRIHNTGAAVTVDLHAVEDETATRTVLEDGTTTLQQNELAATVAYIQALSAGTHYVTIQVLRQGIVLGQAQACIQAQHDDAAVLRVPERASVRQCELSALPVQVRNTGTRVQTFQITGDALSPASATLAPGEERTLNLVLDPSSLRLNENVVAVNAKSQFSEGTAWVIADVSSCQSTIVTQITETSTDGLAWTVLVQNNQDTPIRNVTVQVSNLPEGWTYVSTTVTAPPHGQAEIKVTVTRTTADAANPVLTVLVDGQPVATHNAPAIGQSGIATGLFTGSLADGLILAAIVLLVLAAFMFFRAEGGFRDAESHSEATAAGK